MLIKDEKCKKKEQFWIVESTITSVNLYFQIDRHYYTAVVLTENLAIASLARCASVDNMSLYKLITNETDVYLRKMD